MFTTQFQGKISPIFGQENTQRDITTLCKNLFILWARNLDNKKFLVNYQILPERILSCCVQNLTSPLRCGRSGVRVKLL